MNRFLIFTLILFSMLSCKVNREVKKEIKQNILQEQGVETIFSEMKDAQFDFRTLNAKFNAKVLSEKENYSFGGSMRIIKDRNIWISLSAVVGIEAFRISITQDSVKMINRLNKTYFKGNYEIINDLLKTPFDFDMLQAFITGNDFAYYENNIFKVGEDAVSYKISTPSRKKLKNYIANATDLQRILIQDIWIDPISYKIIKQQLKEVSKVNSKLVLDYSEFTDIAGQKLARKIDVDIDADKKMKIVVNFDKVTVDEELNLPFSIPASYVSIEEKQKQ
ncbi:MAG: DUF4292 domain-containing protein [Bacteroidales bacterium]|nr:DUF4292 domain-containing protein [Bacteroidales bacterium]